MTRTLATMTILAAAASAGGCPWMRPQPKPVGPQAAHSWKDFLDEWGARVAAGEGSAAAYEDYENARKAPTEAAFQRCIDDATKAKDDWGGAVCELVAVDDFDWAVTPAAASHWTDDGGAKVGAAVGFGTAAYAYAQIVRSEYLLARDDYDGAAAVMRNATRLQESTLPTDHPDIGTGWLVWCAIDAHWVNHKAASDSCDRALSIREKAFGADSKEVASVLFWKMRVDDDEPARVDASRLESIAASLGDDPQGLVWRVQAAWPLDDLPVALDGGLQAALRRAAGDPWREHLLEVVGNMARAAGELTRARKAYRALLDSHGGDPLRQKRIEKALASCDAGQGGDEVDADAIGLVVRWIEHRPPMFPQTAHVGFVRVVAHLDASGTVIAVEPVAGDQKVFVDATIDAVRHWRARPVTIEGKPMGARTSVAIQYR